MSQSGRFQMVDGDDVNMDQILVATGAGEEIRKMSRTLRPILEVHRDGDKWTLIWTAEGKVVTQNFTLGQESEYTTADGRQAKSICHIENGVFVQHETINGKTVKHERTINGDELIMNISFDNLKARRVYKRLD